MGLVCSWESSLRFSAENSGLIKNTTVPNVNAELYPWILKAVRIKKIPT